MKHPLLQLDLATDRDIVAARQRARQVSALTGFDAQDQARIATAVSELARNALRYAGGGRAEFTLDLDAPADPVLRIVVSDAGPGIGDVEAATAGNTAGGEPKLGLVTARRMVDSFDVDSTAGRGTTIILGKKVPRRVPPFTRKRIDQLVAGLASRGTDDPSTEIQLQNRELLRSLEELRLRQEELERLNSELEDTNRGVMALYAELDERATHLRLADETKSRFLSSVSHEFRTPVNSILALARILLHRLDGDLTAEQEKQVRYIFQAAEQLSTLIDDLLDLRKVESGKVRLRVESFTVEELFAALRGMFKPLSINENVTLVIEEPQLAIALRTDRGKVSQILRNLISNALKFTERGSVRVACRLSDAEHIVFDIADTGIGIAPDHHRRIFDEFSQVENPLQAVVKGTGLGLPLSQRLAGLLGGSIAVRSDIGKGSVFSLGIPLCVAAEPEPALEETATVANRPAHRVLIVDDNEIERYALRQFLSCGRYDVIEASGGYEGLRLARQLRPDFIFLDLVMPDLHGYEVLRMLRAVEETRSIPVVIFTSQRLSDADRDKVAGATALLSKNELSRETVAELIRRIGINPEVDDANARA